MYATGAAETGQSLRFEDGDSAYLSWTPASAGDRQTYTISAWVKRGNLGTSQNIFSAGTTGPIGNLIFDTTDQIRYYESNSAITAAEYQHTNAVFRDVGAWYHVVVAVDTTQSTYADRVKIYVNNELQSVTVTNQNTVIGLSASLSFNKAEKHSIGALAYNTTGFMDGYLANVCFIDGTALDPTSFGEYQTGTTLWKPKDVSGLTFGTNGFFLNFSDSADIGADTSGNGNDWTPSNLAATDVVLDGPYNGGNFCVVNHLTKSSGGALQEGNLKIPFGGTYPSTVMGSMGVSSGKWYWEILFTGGAYNNGHAAGIATPEMANRNIDPYATTSPYNHYYDSRGLFYNSGTNTSASTFAPNDIIGFALDIDNDEISYYKNGTLVGSAQSIETGQTWMPFHKNSSFTALTQSVNFGQDSSFAGQKTPQGNTDDNGLGDFYYAPPSGGFLALNTANMSEPDILLPDEYHKALLYTGNGSTQSITGLGWQPDFVWIKNRSEVYSHQLFDPIRGATYRLSTDGIFAEAADPDTLTSFDSDGFSTGDDFKTNKNTNGYVAWNWLLDNSTGSSNTDGDITSTVAVNTTSKVSVLTYTGTGSANSVGHGLGVKPDFVIIKKRNASGTNWYVYNSIDGYTKQLTMEDESASATTANKMSAEPTSTVLNLSTSDAVNGSGNSYVAWCFAEVEGFCSVGKYTGNGSTNGTMVFTGMRPAFVLVKSTSLSTTQWLIWDNKRDTYNLSTNALRPNVDSAESTGFDIDILSNGFKVRDTGTETSLNQSSASYLFLAFSEAALKYANAR